jgi:hypothetical protein
MVISWSDGIHHFTEPLNGIDLGMDEVYEGTFTNPFIATNPDEYLLNFSITSVGSHPDELAANNSATTTIVGVATVVPRRVVGEESTGTWCGWCPRGAVYMELMHQAYPDLFIPLAVHNGPVEPMKDVEYEQGLAIFAHFPASPSVLLDRKMLVDPLELDSVFQALREVVAPVEVNVHATLDSLSHAIYVEGNITTYANRTNAKYKLVLVVAENDVRGTSNGYRQTNYYSGGGEGVMGGFENLGNPVPASQMRYDFVGRKLLYGFNGLSGVVPATFHENDVFGFTATYVSPDTYDADQLYIVAMVVDSASGEVLNAARSESLTSAVKEKIREPGALNIYPNPAQGVAYLDMELTEAAAVTVELVNQLGQSVLTQHQGPLPAGHSVLALPIAGLSAGVYLVKMNISGKSLLRKLVVE